MFLAVLYPNCTARSTYEAHVLHDHVFGRSTYRNLVHIANCSTWNIAPICYLLVLLFLVLQTAAQQTLAHDAEIGSIRNGERFL
jgi:hypothetical protein